MDVDKVFTWKTLHRNAGFGSFQDADFAGDLSISKLTSGRVLYMYGSRTFVPVGCTCQKQTVVSHSRTEAELVSWDAGLRSDGTPAARQRCCV